MPEQRRSYAGECVYVGVDVHKETYTVTCVQTPPRHPCHQWERKLTGSSRGKSPLGTRHFLPYTRPMSYML